MIMPDCKSKRAFLVLCYWALFPSSFITDVCFPAARRACESPSLWYTERWGNEKGLGREGLCPLLSLEKKCK